MDRLLRERAVVSAMRAGTTILRPETVTLDDEVVLGEDTALEPFVTLLGKTVVGERHVIGQGCVVKDSVFGKNVVVKPYCVIESAVVGDGCVVGPFARLREGTELAEGVHVGNFVETKKAKLHEGVKANHLTYLGRHGDRRADERRRGRHHVQLRRLRQAQDDDRRGRLRGLGRAARRARDGRRWRRSSGPARPSPTTSPKQRARDLARTSRRTWRARAPSTARGRRRADPDVRDRRAT